MADIFLSYNREDQGRAGAFAKALEAEGLSVWWDVGLRVGEAYDEVTERALREAKAVIVLWSKKSVVSRWVRAEATLALRNKTLFPCMIEPCDRPIMFELTQTADLSHWRGAGDDPAWRVFLADLKRFIEGGAPSEISEPDRLAARPRVETRRISLDRRTAIIAGGASLVAGAVVFALLRPRAPSLAENGVAVLPFRNLSGDASQDYLSAGLSSEIRSVLARNAALRVVAQTSCEAVRKQALGAIEIAKTLAVSFLLDGNVALVGERVKIAAELIDGKTGFSKWSQSFDYPIAELSRIQESIAAQVANQLSIGAPAPSKSGEYGATQNAEAFASYLKGTELYEISSNLDTDLAALDRFDTAISLDPKFGAAYAARATSLTTLGNFAESVAEAQQYYSSAVEAAQRAVALGPSSADAHSTLGFVFFQAQLRVKDAREPYDRSHELGRGVAYIVARFASYAAATKRGAEARSAVDRAILLDPLNATVHRALGFVHYASREFEKSIAPIKTALSLNPKLSDSHARIAAALIALNRPEEALAAAQQERNALVRLPVVAIAEKMAGNSEAAENAMAELKRIYGDAGLYQQAQVLARWGRADETMGVLARAKELGDSGLTYAYIDPALDILRNREDFIQLQKALGFL